MAWVLETKSRDPDRYGNNIWVYDDLIEVSAAIGDLKDYAGVALYEIDKATRDVVMRGDIAALQALSILPSTSPR